jgi:predicted SAM-dependent methyltransferase
MGAEYCLERRLRAIPKSRYVTADSMVSLVDLLEVTPAVCASVTELSFRSDCFDLVICSHVLEHVKQDRLAMGELFRVTKPGGAAFVPVPVDWDRAETDERECLSVEERARFYGEADHVRQYGRDYVQRLKDAGFQVDTYR